MRLASFFLFLLLLCQVGISRTVLSIFPFENRSEYTLTDWLGYGIVDGLFSAFLMDDSFQVWDPVFKSKTEHHSDIFHCDSLLKLHGKKWNWNIAIGGRYSIKKDSVLFVLTVVENSSDSLKKTHNRYRGPVSGAFAFIESAISELALQLNGSTPLSDIFSNAREFPNTYMTYSMGFGYEMKGKPEAAVSAYLRALEMTPSFYRASLRLGSVYTEAGRIEEGIYHLKRALSTSTSDTVFTALAVSAIAPLLPASQASKIAVSTRDVLSRTSVGLLALGKIYLQTGEYNRAISALTRSVASGPSTPETEFMLGMAYIRKGDYSTAIDIVNNLLKQFPQDPVYLSVLGTVYRNANRYMESSSVLENVLSEDPDNQTALIELANTWFRLGWYEKSAQLLSRLTYKTSSGKILNNLGVIFWHSGQEDNAEELFQRALEFPQTRQIALNNLGNVYYHRKENRNALSFFKQAQKSGEVNIDILHNLGRVYASKGDYERALSYYEKIEMIAPRDQEILSEIAYLYSILGKYPDAAQYYAQIMNMQPYNRDILKRLYFALKESDNCQNAVEYFEEYLFRLPFDIEMAVLLADAYICMEWYEVAVVKYQEIISRFPDKAQGYAGLAYCYSDMINKGLYKDIDRTIYTFLLAAKIDTSEPQYYLEIGDLYMYKKGYRELAVDNWKKAIELSEDQSFRDMVKLRISEVNTTNQD